MAGSSATSTLDIVLKDDVSRSAAQIDAALRRIVTETKAVDHALAQGGASDKMAAGLRRIGASVPAIEGATRAMREYAAAEGLAASRGDWTTRQAAGYANMERVTLAGVRAIMSAERALEEQRSRAAAHHQAQMQAEIRTAERQAALAHRMRGHDGHFDTSTFGGTVAMAGAYAFEHAMHGVLERYRDFDKERRYARVVMGLTDEQQEPLVHQALTGGATSRFNDIQWLEAQREFAARGYNLDQVKAFTPIAADVGTAFDQTLPESVKAIEGAMLGFGKDVSTYEKAVAAARRTADLEVKTSKVSGMSFEDITQLYKYGAAPAKLAGLSEETMLAFGATLKKQNMGGDEAGVAFRALASKLVKPTLGGITAMRANGIDFSKYQAARPMDVAGFTQIVAQRYGVRLSAAAQAGIAKIFTDKAVVGDASKFTPAIVSFLRGALGGNDAKSLKSIATLARDYRAASLGGVDTVRLLTDLMGAMSKNKSLANAMFGAEQGGRIFAALGDPEVFNGLLEQITHHSAGFAGNVAAARNEGFNGQVSQLQGAIATLESSIGRAFDANGSGGTLTQATSWARQFVQAMSEMNPSALRATVEAAGAAAVVAGLKSIDFISGGFGLKPAAAEMMSAGEVQLQAGRLMLEAAGLRAPGGRPPIVPPGGPGAVPPEAPKGIYSGEGRPIPPEAAKGGSKFFGEGGAKGFAGGLAEGIIGGILYQAGVDAIDAWFGATAKAKFDKVMQFPALHELMDRAFGKVTDETSGPDPYRSGERQSIDERARRSADAFRQNPEAERGERMMRMFGPSPEMAPFYQDPEGSRGRAMMHMQASASIAPNVDTTGLDAVKAKAGEAHAAIDGLNTTVSPSVSLASLDALIAKAHEAREAVASIGSMGGVANASIGARRSFQPAPAGRIAV